MKHQRVRNFMLIVLAIQVLGSVESYAYDNRCRSYPEGDTRSICPGRSLPASQTRGRTASSLTCSGSVDHFVRKPQEIPDYGRWQALISTEGAKSEAAFRLRQQQSEVKWSGRIPYSTIEEWGWIACELGTSASECGTDRVCKTEPHSYTVNDCDAQNNCTSRTVTESRTVCDDVARTCYYDVRRSASQHCSSEVMTYDARFARDPKWNVSHPSYSEFIPNKYDLLPGELEMIQTFNGQGRMLSPNLKIGDAWNKYSVSSAKINGGGSTTDCRPNNKAHVEFEIHTVERLVKPSPNAFQLPVDHAGKSLRPLEWAVDTDSGEKVRPIRLKLTDSSAALVKLMAQQSQAVSSREKAKSDLGLGQNSDKMDLVTSKAAEGFYKNTVLRFQLKEDQWYRTTSFTKPRFIRDAEAVTLGNLRLSKIQALRNSDYWDIPLNDSDLGSNIYSYDKWLPKALGVSERGLKPLQRYVLSLSMYQQGVPFYLQICDENQAKLNPQTCAKSESDVYSKPIELPFWTSKADARPLLQQLNEFTLVDWLYRKFRNRTPGEEGATP